MKDKSTLEEICVADGDAISHFDNSPSLYHLAYVIREYNIEEGTKFIINKLNRSYSKLSPHSKEVFKEKYNKMIERII